LAQGLVVVSYMDEAKLRSAPASELLLSCSAAVRDFSTLGNGETALCEEPARWVNGQHAGRLTRRRRLTMEYFAGLDVSMEETHLCVVDRDGVVIHQAKAVSTPEAIATALNAAPACRRVVFETGRMAPMLYHGLQALGVPVLCIESRQAHQALKSLATHKTDRNDARGLAHLARTGFFKPVHVKSLPAHAIRSLILARKKLVGQRVTLENQIRGLAVVFGVRLPRALSPAFLEETLRLSDRVGELSGAMRGLIAAREAVLRAVAAIDTDMRRLVRTSDACRRLMTIPGVGQLTALAFTAAIDAPERFRRSRDLGAYLGLVPRRYQSGEVDYTGGISKCGDKRVRTLLYEAANVLLTRYQGPLKLKDWAMAIAQRSTKRKARIALARRLAIIMHAMLRHGTEFRPA
jgi:transposase